MVTWVTGGLPLLSPLSRLVGVVSTTSSTHIPPFCPLSIMAVSQMEHFVCTCGLTDFQWMRRARVPFLRLAFRRVLASPLCALDLPFCRACTGVSSAADFYPTVKAALRHESADSEEDRESLGCRFGLRSSQPHFEKHGQASRTFFLVGASNRALTVRVPRAV